MNNFKKKLLVRSSVFLVLNLDLDVNNLSSITDYEEYRNYSCLCNRVKLCSNIKVVFYSMTKRDVFF